MKYPLGDMTYELCEKIIGQLPDNTTIVPFFRGESTLHPLFPEMMRLLDRFEAVQLATNGDHLTPPVRGAILDYCTFLSISLHEYKLPVDVKFQSLLYQFKGVTQISILDSVLPEEKRSEFYGSWNGHVDRIRVYETHSRDGYGSMNGHEAATQCRKPFEEMVVYWDGRVGLCNHDWDNLSPVGDLNKQSVIGAWSSPEYASLRAHHTLMRRDLVETCKACSFSSGKVYGELVKCQ